ncbi:hypothetical protein S7711_04791 [Stachybotrys chartarum IBT 7711]|uniref:MIT domain-containing protein n=1 Tax=Stachybotrys chartarum (strain CBS 109288 / IBT 7711) TaxID=1280523 RepID=A0A084ASI1_STACB|nr:hypothetical protein S7711_04791 [Stachybotrys chartarum IBT 7711]KFA50038.1 hypothetical protein S40293_06851 [Stachybotrys chartarum IBT 40293]
MPGVGVPNEPSDLYSTVGASTYAHLSSTGASPRLPTTSAASKPMSRTELSSYESPLLHAGSRVIRPPRHSSLHPAAGLVPSTFYSHSPDPPPHVPLSAAAYATTDGGWTIPNQTESAPFSGDRHRLNVASGSALGNTGPYYQRHRWSASTGSSRTSVLVPRASSSGRQGRRASFDTAAFLAESPPSSKPSSRKLQKNRRPSASTLIPSEDPPRGPLDPAGSSTPTYNLPPVTLPPSLEQTIPNHYARAQDPQQSGGAWHHGVFQTSPTHPRRLDSAAMEGGPATLSAQVTLPHDQNHGVAQSSRGHSRSRSGQGSNDSSKARNGKALSQKAMLSRALQKANTAVKLDNAQNFEGARAAYAEACELLQHVLQRTSADEDKRKLQAIHRTYTSRIHELDHMGPWQGQTNKALPARPTSVANSQDTSLRPDTDEQDEERGEGGVVVVVDEEDSEDEEEDAPVIETATVTRIVKDDNAQPAPEPARLALQTSELGLLQSSFSRSPIRNLSPSSIPFTTTADASPMPPPLSPRRPPSPPTASSESSNFVVQPDFSAMKPRNYESREPRHIREDSQNSWLDPIDESGGSTGSSIHSRTSSWGYRRKPLRASRGETEVEFDTALDAAIEAAYDEGYEPAETSIAHPESSRSDDEDSRDPLRRVELARERVRQTEQEALEMASELGVRLQVQRQKQYPSMASPGDFYDENSSEDEERILEEMTRDYTIEDFAMNPLGPFEASQEPLGSRSRQHSSVSPTAAVPLSSIAESGTSKPSHAKQASIPHCPPAPPPTQSLPELPPQRLPHTTQTVRNRRLSGQNPTQLKIKTALTNPAQPGALQDAMLMESRGPAASQIAEQRLAEATGPSTRRPSSPLTDLSPTDTRPLDSPFGSRGTYFGTDEGAAEGHTSPSPERLHKNLSSSSLRSLKSRNMSMSNFDDGSDMSPSTPSSTFFSNSRVPAVPALPTPLTTAFREKIEGPSTGLSLFDDNFHAPNSPGSPNSVSQDAPVPLEPCPVDFMLRPFWLMRSLYQTLVHPRGGYLSTKLFVPRDVWRVKGVKLKNVDDKISHCDYLTAALLKLAKVDTYDADAVLEEMQSLEGILEEVQAALSRKLGNEVGVQGSGTLFKEAGATAEGANASNLPRSASVSGKTPSSFSWRRLRSKNSAVGLGASNGTRIVPVMETGKDAASLASLPMTTHPTSRPAKREVGLAQFTGPNANYMSSLARLFDAAQVIDQIARQVDDPGLRHADKTQVGLELCTRHAAEFFGFYICRFVLVDLGLLVDKFIKRGSEWVLI